MGDALSTKYLDNRIKVRTRPSVRQRAWEILVSHALLLLDVGEVGAWWVSHGRSGEAKA